MILFVLMVGLVSCGDSDTGGTGCTSEFPNYHDGRCWSEKALNTKNWDDATNYCQNLDGRLPTISELRTLIQNCPDTETGGACEVTDSCLEQNSCWLSGVDEENWESSPCMGCSWDSYSYGEYSVFGHKGYFWSSSVQSDDTSRAWFVDFSFGIVGSYSKMDAGNTMCVK